MSESTTAGLDMQRGSRHLRGAVELLSSMRFAIALLMVICIASVVGTVVLQNEPINNYINQFGPFWYRVFEVLGLYDVYSATWFMLIILFLVISTSLCLIRSTPKILADLKLYKENIREQSLAAFPHKARGELHNEDAEAAARRIGGILVASGWKVRLQQRSTPTGSGWMVAAKAGAANKWGYIATHAAIVMICVGALLDGDMMVRAQMWLHDKSVFTGGGLIADVPEQYRISDNNPTFRGNLLVTEGARAGTAILARPQGVVLQELPFYVELNKFVVEYHDNGMPSLFASDIVIHDKHTGERTQARVTVNDPVSHRGIMIYQASYDDGGSLVNLKAMPMGAAVRPFTLEGRIGSSTSLSNGDQRMQLEFTGLRVINVENFAIDPPEVVAGGPLDLRQELEARMGSGHRTIAVRELRNVGPSVTYKLRDEAGQAREFHNYMLPMDLDGQRVFVLGVRETQAEDFRYLRIPVDENGAMDGFINLRTALADEAMRREAVRRYVAEAARGQRPDLQQALTVSAQRAIDLFAGQDPEVATLPRGDMPVLAGLQALNAFIVRHVPEAERERAGEMLLRLLNGTLFELYQLSREGAGLPPAERGEEAARFMTQSVLSLSDAFFYPAPLTFQLTNFEHVEASVFMVTRAPGKYIVYLGCLLLTIGMFAMLYVRQRRMWVWLAPKDQEPGLQVSMALSSNRKLMDNDREFKQLKERILFLKAAEVQT